MKCIKLLIWLKECALTSKKRFPLCNKTCIVNVLGRARTLFSRLLHLTDDYIIYEAGMCAVLYVLMFHSCTQLLPACYVHYGIPQLIEQWSRGARQMQRHRGGRGQGKHRLLHILQQQQPHFHWSKGTVCYSFSFSSLFCCIFTVIVCEILQWWAHISFAIKYVSSHRTFCHPSCWRKAQSCWKEIERSSWIWTIGVKHKLHTAMGVYRMGFSSHQDM